MIKKIIFLLQDVVLIFIAFWLSFGLRLNITLEWEKQGNWLLFFIIVVISIIGFIKLGLYRAVIRYAGGKVLNAVLLGSIASVLAMLIIAFYFHIPLPRSIPITYFLLTLVLLTGSRFTIKGLLQSEQKKYNRPVIIYGAGQSGRQLLEATKQVDEYYPVAFVDDDKQLQNTVIGDKTVYSPNALYQLIERYGVKKILLAIPSASSVQKRHIVNRLDELACKILTIPNMKDLVDGTVNINALKKVSAVDLLGRDAIDPISHLMTSHITDKVVMVTGAGGSIGSELCRQIIKQNPSILLLFELSEFSLYKIERELGDYLQQQANTVKIIALLGSVQNQKYLTTVMQTFAVDTVYHAAAYKHVPLVERNTIESVKNNIFGTLYCALAAMDAKVKTFVLISTDKAVRSTNTMGATKRMAELILQALANEPQQMTQFCMVRFGNVLGSSGSVIPLFEKQISQGGPVTVTHNDITRYFMTITEAAQLVIQAGAMGKGGDVFVLDMGEPVRIIDLATQMIHLSGLTVKDSLNPHGDIEIVVTGLRAGEKLYEELLISGEVFSSDHPRIMTTKEVMMPWHELRMVLEQLKQACGDFDYYRIRTLLLAAPTGFSPSDDMCDIVGTVLNSQAP